MSNYYYYYCYDIICSQSESARITPSVFLAMTPLGIVAIT